MSIAVTITSIEPRVKDRFKAYASANRQTLQPDQIIVSIDRTHSGAVANRNRGLMAVSADWFAPLDDDDWFLDNHLEVLMNAAQETGADVIYSMPESGPRLRYGLPFDGEALQRGNYIHATGCLVRTEAAKAVGGYSYPEVGPLFEDWNFYLKLLGAGATFHHVPQSTWHWYVDQNTTKGLPENW